MPAPPPVPMRTIGKDIVIEIYRGGMQGVPGVWTGPTWDTAIPLTALAKSVRVPTSMETTSVRTPGDDVDALRGNVDSYSIDIELAVDDTGPIVLTMGECAKVVYAPFGTLDANGFTLLGLFTGNEWADGGDGVQTQKITIEGPAEGVTA